MAAEKSPNVILIVVDQMRADCLSLNSRDKFINTPTLDMLASQGYNFTNAYSTVPTCVPARAALLTGLNQQHSGRVGYQDEVPWNYANTLPQYFKDRGYQTYCVGKMHVFPTRKRLGFDHIVLNDGYLHVHRKYGKAYGQQFEYSNDYHTFLKEEMGFRTDVIDNGLHCNSWQARPWHLEEYLHPTNWTVSEGIKFLQIRDSTVPFFLKLSFEKPHAPLDPPKYYFDMYMERLADEADLHIGNWEELVEGIPDSCALKGKLKADDQKRMLAGYYGLITHIDHQINRFLMALKEAGQDKNTLICFVSDHGDQLGEHYLFRKGYPYQGSIHIPFFIYDPSDLIQVLPKRVDQLVTLQDVFPSLVDIVFNQSVDVDGRSVKPLLEGAHQWRDDFHGEHALGEESSQFVRNERWKLIWYPVKDVYQLFDIIEDPNEMNNCIEDVELTEVIEQLKKRLTAYLEGREEGFVQNNVLTKRNLSHIVPTLSIAFDNS